MKYSTTILPNTTGSYGLFCMPEIGMDRRVIKTVCQEVAVIAWAVHSTIEPEGIVTNISVEPVFAMDDCDYVVGVVHQGGQVDVCGHATYDSIADFLASLEVAK